MDPQQGAATGGDIIADAVRDTAMLDTVANNLGLIAAFVLAFYVAASICAVREIMNSRTSQGSIAWLLSLFFLPFFTVPAYFVLGWKQFGDYAEIQRKLGRYERNEQAHALKLADSTSTRHWPVLSRVSDLPFLAGNRCDLLIDGDATFSSIIDGIKSAQKSILFQFFIVRHDDLGRKIADALVERAQAGVSVYFLYDDVGSKDLSAKYLSRLREKGVHVSGFNEKHKYLKFLGPMRINYRNHRKIVVVDNQTAWVGGHNVGDEYLGKSKRFGHWRDTHVKVAGPAAIACTMSFLEDWRWASGEEIPQDENVEILQPGDEPVLVTPTGPADPLEECSIAFAEAAARSRKRLWIVSPYFVPGIDIQTALYAAAIRGVDVRILLPEKSDHRTVWLASHAHADDMVAHEVKVYRYTEGFLHQKVMLVDDELASIGTVNFDNRSFRINFEITLWFTHQRMIEKVENMLEADFANARQSLPGDLDKRSYIFRILAQGARLFSPVL